MNHQCMPMNEVWYLRNNKVNAKLQKVSSAKSDENDSCVIGGSFAYILMLTSIFGMAPLRFRCHEKGFRISISKPMCIYSYILVFSLGSTALLGKVAQINLDVNTMTADAKLPQLISLYFHFTITMTAVTGVIGAHKCMRNLIMHLNAIAMVDISLGTKYSRVKDFKMFLTAVSMFTLLSTLIVKSYYSRTNNGSFQFAQTAMDIVMYIKMNLHLQLVYIFYTVRNRFKSINDALMLITCQWSAELESYVPEPVTVCIFYEGDADRAIIARKSNHSSPCLVVSPNEAIQRIALLRGTLCDIINNVNTDSGLPIIITLLSAIMNIVVPLYFSISSLTIPDPLKKVFEILIYCLWLILHTSVIIFLIEPCHRTMQQDKKTRQILRRMMRLAPPSAKLFSLLEMFGYQVMLKPASYEPLHMCMLNRPLMMTILGAVSTYLVILVKY